MKRLIVLMMCAVSLGAAAQSTITYPYNPDGNADALIGVTDLQDMLSTYGGAFSPSDIQIDGVGLLQIIQDLQNQLNALQTIDVNAVESTLTALQEEVDALEAENTALAQQVQDLQNAGYATETWVEEQGYSAGSGIEGLEEYLSVDETNKTILISGANLQVVSGEGSTDAPVNGTGNIIIGYDEEAFSGSYKSGSHNLVVGDAHTYSSYGGIVVGYNNSITGYYSSVSGGASNTASGYYSSVSGGELNSASGYYSSVSGRGTNTAAGEGSSVSGGVSNNASGDWSSASGQYDIND